ncbi:MAG: tRNA (N(6)-L-threonylcarbamoyladenosine(37)-C(2))-methylthiotransferase MtaB [bacterium]|nr:tRNA (N(6)-L-threonylcarbamoyladenosine(37)-C(2))-methylthiotransferase MtaB [bacterium]
MTKETRAPRFSIHTLGCKVNQYDSERIRTRLLQRGFESLGEDDNSSPDVIVVNTCSVTSESDRKGRQLIRKMIRRHPEARVMVTGCYAERKPLEIGSIEGVDEIVAIQDQDAWAARLAEELGWGCADQSHLWTPGAGIEIFQEHTRAFIKIQDGCDLKCTFCSIPASRGVARSRPVDEILDEARDMIDRGYPELVLCGICIGHYGRGLDFGLPDLILRLNALPGVKRIRVSSLEPQDVDDELLRVMADSEAACPHLHLPIQSGSNRILRRMKRPYKIESFFETIEKARRMLPDFEVSTDIMVGFPDETEDDFEQTLQAVRISRFNKVHSFPFSVRDEAPAARMTNHLPPELIKSRRIELDRVARETADVVKSSYIGRTLRVLCETRDEDRVTGYTENYLRAEFPANESVQRGGEVTVRVESVDKGRLIARPV